MSETSIAQVVGQLEALGVRRGGVLLVHTSYRAVRPVRGGPLGLIEALTTAVGERGTLVMPTMTDGASIFDPAQTPTLDMGITAELFWRQPGVVRSTHPGASFAARGPAADAICAPQPLAPPHGPDSPVGRVWALDGQVLLLGVGHDANTTVHLAEVIADVPYQISHPCVVEVEGTPREVLIPETDHCCRGFARLDAWLRADGTQRDGPVGHARARLMRARDVVRVALGHLDRAPLVFLCGPSTGCAECDRARASLARAAG